MNNIHIKDNEALQKKIDTIKESGVDSFHVVSDFDRTITRCIVDGEKTPSVISLIRKGGYLSEDYAKKAYELFDMYHPIELDNKISFDQKFQKMQEWWEKHEKLLIQSGMRKEIIDDILQKYPRIFRDRVLDFLAVLNQKQIPVLFFSAGIGNMIEGYLEKENRLTSNIHILSNTFAFDINGIATGYKDRVIHVLNKTEDKITDPAYKAIIAKRKNVLLLGDSYSDKDMVLDESCNVVIRVGFLNEDIEENLDRYMNVYDVVITHDGDFSYVNSLLNEMLF